MINSCLPSASCYLLYGKVTELAERGGRVKIQLFIDNTEFDYDLTDEFLVQFQTS